MTVAAHPWRFVGLACGLFAAFGVHNFLQESIMSMPGFHWSVMLGFMEVFGVTVCSGLELRLKGFSFARKAPLTAYAFLCLCLMSSSWLSNWALSYINYPTKVVFRSCKLIPAMIIAVVYNRRSFDRMQYIYAISISLGLAFFALADAHVSPSFQPFGLVLVSLSVVADAFLPNFQERVFETGASKQEVTFWTNIFTLTLMTASVTVFGDLSATLAYARDSEGARVRMLVYTFISYIAISFHMQLVKDYGGVSTVLVGCARKAMTIAVSFLQFPKPFSILHVLGALLVFGGLVGSAQSNQGEKGYKKVQASSDDKEMDTEEGERSGKQASRTSQYDIGHRQPLSKQ